MEDPILAEFHATEVSTPPPSITASASKCPIRFLDQHSPEEVAKYFQNHKHEIPRSHEICVKRYQSNAEGIRQLDAKYGNLVNMIQGLGVKHQPLLPTKQDEQVIADEQKSLENLAKWAEDCSGTADEPAANGPSLHGDAEERQPHFDRPLKDVRVGESPSRPWGISVPLSGRLALSSTSLFDGQQAPRDTTSGQPSTGQRPSSHQREEKRLGSENSSRPRNNSDPKSRFTTNTQNEQTSQTGVKNAEPQMLFTGPVFIGYSAKEASTLIKAGKQQ